MIFWYLFLIYMIYSFLGWLIEVIDLYFIEGKFVNRGFMIGPYCPIYGKAVLIVIYFLKDYLEKPVGLFVMSVVVCAIIEYMGSFILEKIFHTRWWDYTHKKYNINGRICLENLVLFGIGCMLVMYVVNPFIVGILSKIPEKILIIISICIFIIYLCDFIISFDIIWKFHKISDGSKKDNTESVTAYVKKEIEKKNKMLYNRLVSSFPHLKVIRERREKFHERRRKKSK